jgi:hypothetical protein
MHRTAKQLTVSLQKLAATTETAAKTVSCQIPRNLSSANPKSPKEAEDFLRRLDEHRVKTKDVRVGTY